MRVVARRSKGAVRPEVRYTMVQLTPTARTHYRLVGGLRLVGLFPAAIGRRPPGQGGVERGSAPVRVV